jgi:hypothetical protein
MKKPMKAALLSAFVFPGTGHFLLKKYFAGAVLAGTAIAALYFLTTKTLERALQLTEKLQSGEVPLNAATITELASRPATGSEAQLLNVAVTFLLISWLVGIIDSYRAGRAQENDVGAGPA